MTSIAALRRAGMVVESKQGMFRVPKGARDWPLIRATEDGVKRFVSKFEKEGWKLEGRPKVKLIQAWKGGFKPALDTKGTTTLWLPQGVGMPEDHPWWVPDKDAYTVAAWFSRPQRSARIEIPDATYKRLEAAGKLPAGLKLAD